MTEPELNQALAFLDKQHVEAFRPAYGEFQVSKKKRAIRRRATELLYAEHAKGKGTRKAVRSVRWKLLKEYGFDPTVWIMIFNLVMQIAPLLWEWWNNREEVEGGLA